MQHRRVAHVPTSRMNKTARSLGITGLHVQQQHHKCECTTCLLMNAKKSPFKKKAEHRSKTRGERFHSDVKELSVQSKQGHRYAVCFVDDCTRRGKSYSIKHKSEVLSKWRYFLEHEVLSKGFE